MQYPKYNRFYTYGQAESPRDTEIDRRGDKQTKTGASVLALDGPFITQ